MKLLEKENWWIWLALAFLSGGSSVLVLGALLNVYDKDSWYYRCFQKLPKVLLIVLIVFIGLVALVSTYALPYITSFDLTKLGMPIAILVSVLFVVFMALSFALTVFQIQILTQVNAKLKTPGSEIYLSPYIWILGLIVPIIGWIILLVMYLYLQIWYLVMLYRGGCEKNY